MQPVVVDEASQVSVSLPATDSQTEVDTLKQELLNKQQVCKQTYISLQDCANCHQF